MRICMFDEDGGSTLGIRLGDALVSLPRIAPALPQSLMGLLESGPRTFDEAERAAAAAGASAFIALDAVRYRVPVGRAGKILCLGLNYADHAKEGGHDKPSYPSFFMRSATSLVAHEAPIVRPRASEQLDSKRSWWPSWANAHVT